MWSHLRLAFGHRHDDYVIIDGAIMSYDTATNYLAHYGTPKMRWGQRWYQYEDGSLTPLGRIHYGYGKSKKDYALAAAWATKEGLKVGAKSVGKAAVSGAKAIANAKRKADEGDFERRKRKAAETAEGVAKNPEYFTNEELKSLNERFNTESQIRDKGAKEHKEKKAYREMIAEEKAREKTQKRLEKDARKKAKEEEKKAKAAKADEKYKKDILAKGPEALLKPENRRLFTNEELEAARVRFDKEAAIRKQVNDKRYEDQQAAITRAKTYIDAADKAFKMAQSGVDFAKKMDEAVYLIKGHHLFNPNDTTDRRSKDDKNKDQQNQPKNNNNQPKNNGGGQPGGNNQPKNNPPGGGMQTVPWTPSSNQNGQQNIWNTLGGEDSSKASKEVLKGVKKPKYDTGSEDYSNLDLTDVKYSVLNGAELVQALDEIYGKKIKHSDYLIINGSIMSYDMAVSYLEHSGTKGMRWGVRRWQNYDGSLTEAGYRHYGYGKTRRSNKDIARELNDAEKIKALNKRKMRDVKPDIDYYDGVSDKMRKLMAEGRETKERGEAALDSYKTARARYQAIIDEHKKNIESVDKRIAEIQAKAKDEGYDIKSKTAAISTNNGKEIAIIAGSTFMFGIPGFAASYIPLHKEEYGTKYKVKTSEAQKIKESLEDPFERAMYENYKARENKESAKDFDGVYDDPGVKKSLKQTSETKANINKYKNVVGKDATEARKILESVTSDCIVPDDSFTKASPETKRRLDASAKLGLQALNRMNGNNQWDPNNKDNKNWFVYEDQTLGLATVADMVNRGYTSKDVGNLVKTVNNNSIGALAIDERYMDDWYDSKAGAVSFFLTEGDNGKGGLEKFAKACEEVKKEQHKAAGNLSNKITDRSLKGEKTYNQGDVADLIKMGYSSTEIARMTGVSESSVRSQRKRVAKHSDIPEYIVVDGYLMHYGVKGQKKGVRQWQNKDGSLTPAGRERYGYGVQKKSAPSMYDIYSGGGSGLDDEEEDDEQETEETTKTKSSNPVLDFVVANMTHGLYDTNDVKETANTYRNKYQSVTGKTESKPKNEPKVFGSIHIGANQETVNLAKERGRQLADAFNKRKDEYFSHLHLVSRTTKRKSK